MCKRFEVASWGALHGRMAPANIVEPSVPKETFDCAEAIFLTSIIPIQAQSFCLNSETAHPMSNLFIGDERLFLLSDCDEQLLITLNFKETVNIDSISFGSVIDGAPFT